MDGNLCVFSIAPSENASVYKGFCKTPFIGFVEDKADEIVWIENPFAEDSKVASMFLKFLIDKGIDRIIAGDKPGAGVFPILERAGIEVYVYKGSVQEAIEMYRQGKLKKVTEGYPKGDCQ